MTEIRSCECPPPITGEVMLVVRGGLVAGVSDAATAEPLAPADAAFFRSVDGLYDLIEELLDEEVAVEATYHGSLGYPLLLSADPVREAVDDEILYRVTSLEAGGGEAQAALTSARARWGRQGFHDYDLDLRRSCDCAPGLEGTVKVRVRAGEIVSRTFAPRGEPVAEEHAVAYPSVGGLFDTIQDALDRGVDALSVTYEPNLGFPETLTIDYRDALAGDEVEYEVVKLVRVDGGVE